MEKDFLIKSYEEFRDVLNNQIKVKDLYISYELYQLPSINTNNPFSFIFYHEAESYILE